MKRLDDATLPGLLERLARLAPDSPRSFGTLTPARMLAHVRQALVVSAGLEPPSVEKPQSLLLLLLSPVSFRLMTSGLVPWPRGRVKAPPATEVTEQDVGDLDIERERLRTAMADFIRVVEADPRARTVTHPIFGRCTMRQWARLHLFHIEHHFRQFGI